MYRTQFEMKCETGLSQLGIVNLNLSQISNWYHQNLSRDKIAGNK